MPIPGISLQTVDSDAVLVWFLENIHDPYPSEAILASLSSTTSRPVPTISKQLLDLRKQVGWTTLIRTLFHGSRPTAVDAARRFYLQTDPSNPPSAAIQSAFCSIKAKAEVLAFKKPTSSSEVEAEIKAPPVGAPVHPVNEEDEELDTTPPPPVAGRKRRVDETSEGENALPSNPVIGRVSKRSRYGLSLSSA